VLLAGCLRHKLVGKSGIISFRKPVPLAQYESSYRLEGAA